MQAVTSDLHICTQKKTLNTPRCFDSLSFSQQLGETEAAANKRQSCEKTIMKTPQVEAGMQLDKSNAESQFPSR